MNTKYSNFFFQVIRLATIGVFWGRAWQHFFWSPPYRVLLWDQALLGGIVENWFGIPWQEYVTSSAIDARIQLFIMLMGVFYVACGLVAMFVKKLPNVLVNMLLWGAGGLFLLAALYWKDKFYHMGQLFEYSLQFGSPVFLWLLVRERTSTARLIWAMRIAVAVSFFSHGLYAFGYYPRPESFTSMVISSLGVRESLANTLLIWAGWLDFLAAASLLFFPRKWLMPAVIYCVLWGFLTAFARPWANFYGAFWLESLHQNVYEFVYRFPHFLIPLAIFIWLRSRPSEASPR
ncbi:MAG: hypothetical protein KDC34_16085 [Saprospiraceae bacterium]|nr:hypothetical protein [Saprospiraceae bacterium]